jgi:DNA primase catalytic subunit
MKLPFGMRPSTLLERELFYSKFDIKESRDWVGRKSVYAVVLGRHSNIVLPQYTVDKDIPLIIDDYHSLQEVKSIIRAYQPEGVYYDRNYYKDFSKCHARNLRNAWNWENFAGQQLAFDLDPENVNCPIHGTLQERLEKGQGLSFCKTAFHLVKENTVTLHERLCENYSDVRIVFSGRGFHLHVFDKEARTLSRKQRRLLAQQYQMYGIDTWVTEGQMRLIRLPYSLNGVSSRIVLPLSPPHLLTFDPESEALPAFLKLAD